MTTCDPNPRQLGTFADHYESATSSRREFLKMGSPASLWR
jgi:hypothetical protein